MEFIEWEKLCHEGLLVALRRLGKKENDSVECSWCIHHGLGANARIKA